MPITVIKTLTIKSSAFKNDEAIPDKYSCDGSNVNPELIISDIPEGTVSLAITVEDPLSATRIFTHWVMWNIPVTDKIGENTAPGIQGKNSYGENKYSGPCPPGGTHHYHFKIYALDAELHLSKNADKDELLINMEDHILALGEIVGTFRKK